MLCEAGGDGRKGVGLRADLVCGGHGRRGVPGSSYEADKQAFF